jgi:hypothetical protein
MPPTKVKPNGGPETDFSRRCPACGAAPGQPCRRRNNPNIAREWPHQHRNHEPVVLVDIDGVLADMSAFDELLKSADGRPRFDRWRKFFAHLPEARLLDSGADLVHAMHAAGITIRYSTTRPAYTLKNTTDWLVKSELPSATIHTRGSRSPGTHRRAFPEHGPAHLVKLAHCAEVADKHGLAAFIDDEPQAIEALCAAGYPAFPVTDLLDRTTKQLMRLRVQPVRPILPQPRPALPGPNPTPADAGKLSTSMPSPGR